MLQNILEIILLLGIFVGILLLAYLVTKKLAQVRQIGLRNKNLKIIEVLQLGQGQYLYIVQAGTSYQLLGVTKEHITYLKELSGDELNFEEHLSYWVKTKQEKKDEENE